MRAWDGTAYGPGAGTSEGDYTDQSVTDGPAPTPSLTMPYTDRGSWVHVVSFAASPAAASRAPLARPAGRTLAATGASPLPALAAVLLLGAVLALRRRRTA